MFNWIRDLFLKVIRAVKPILLAVFTSAFQILLARLQNIATESITKLATTDMSNEEKRKQAFQDIKSYAISKALSVNDRDINLIIETIYNSLKNQGVIK